MQKLMACGDAMARDVPMECGDSIAIAFGIPLACGTFRLCGGPMACGDPTVCADPIGGRRRPWCCRILPGRYIPRGSRQAMRLLLTIGPSQTMGRGGHRAAANHVCVAGQRVAEGYGIAASRCIAGGPGVSRQR